MRIKALFLVKKLEDFMRYLFLIFLNVFMTATLFAQGLPDQNIKFANSSLGLLSNTRQNDIVLSFNPELQTETHSTVDSIQMVKEAVLTRIVFSDGFETTVSTQQAFLGANEQWILAGALRVGDFVQTVSGFLEIKEIEESQTPQDIYQIEVTPDHTFALENGLIVHNVAGIALGPVAVIPVVGPLVMLGTAVYIAHEAMEAAKRIEEDHKRQAQQDADNRRMQEEARQHAERQEQARRQEEARVQREQAAHEAKIKAEEQKAQEAKEKAAASPTAKATPDTVPLSLKDKLAMEEIMANPRLGKPCDRCKLDDEKYIGSDFIKYEHIRGMKDDKIAVDIHYWFNPKTGEAHGFKFKHHATPKMNEAFPKE